MSDTARARAFANVALVKYWGKRNIELNWPATPSISLAIDSLKTETSITIDAEDRFYLDRRPSGVIESARVFSIVDRWREEKSISGNLKIDSINSFPTGAGLASSASGIAALVTALNGLAASSLGRDELIRRARQGSGSAARSIVGGLSALPNDDDPVAFSLLGPEDIPWGMVIIVTESERKSVGSREAMEQTRLTSPYYNAWIERAEADYREMLIAVRKSDFSRIGEIAERNCLAMHACMIAANPPLFFWNAATISVIHAVRKWRSQGLESYFTIDAGPQVFMICRKEDLDAVALKAADIEGVQTILTGRPAGGAEVVECR